jgi:16S rRNA (adenine1518-N6/adenine1519-N6)-dimethyltransferase
VIGKIVTKVSDILRQTRCKFIIEVGPGDLALTEHLAQLNHLVDQLPYAIVERDYRLEAAVREKIISHYPHTELKMMDAASEDLCAYLSDLCARHGGPGMFVSNLPYSASSQILARLGESRSAITHALVMVQKELAKRMVAGPGDDGRGSFSLLIESHFKCKTLFDVSPGAFSPPPKVMSTVLELVPHQHNPIDELANRRAFEVFCQRLFSGRRKMVRNLVSDHAKNSFESLGLSGQERPETLSLEQILGLYKSENDNVPPVS